MWKYNLCVPLERILFRWSLVWHMYPRGYINDNKHLPTYIFIFIYKLFTYLFAIQLSHHNNNGQGQGKAYYPGIEKLSPFAQLQSSHLENTSSGPVFPCIWFFTCLIWYVLELRANSIPYPLQFSFSFFISPNIHRVFWIPSSHPHSVSLWYDSMVFVGPISQWLRIEFEENTCTYASKWDRDGVGQTLVGRSNQIYFLPKQTDRIFHDSFSDDL